MCQCLSLVYLFVHFALRIDGVGTGGITASLIYQNNVDSANSDRIIYGSPSSNYDKLNQLRHLQVDAKCKRQLCTQIHSCWTIHNGGDSVQWIFSGLDNDWNHQGRHDTEQRWDHGLTIDSSGNVHMPGSVVQCHLHLPQWVISVRGTFKRLRQVYWIKQRLQINTVNITPKFSDSKILMQWAGQFYIDGDAGGGADYSSNAGIQIS